MMQGGEEATQQRLGGRITTVGTGQKREHKEKACR